jgi:cysteine sulfinate desulfinase/cysteine desulfurase-like protein
MGVAEEAARGTVRLSVGRSTTEHQIDTAIDRLAEAWRRMTSED